MFLSILKSELIIQILTLDVKASELKASKFKSLLYILRIAYVADITFNTPANCMFPLENILIDTLFLFWYLTPV